MNLLPIGVMLAWTAAAVAMAWYLASVAGDVTYVTLADGRRQERALPVVFKALLPLVPNFNRMLSRPFFAARAESRQKTLVAAGFEGLLDGREFVALEMMCPVALGGAWCALIATLGAVIPGSPFATWGPSLCLCGVAAAVLMPSLWLRDALKKRHMSIMRALPFVLDLLTLSVEAGLDFISALQRNCRTRKTDPLNEELLRMTHEIQLGASRRKALADMARRVDQPDLKGLANALIQADEFGVSLGAMLRIQSDQLRARRFDRAEKLANEAPTKMLGPLMLCIFPAVFIILLGPVVMNALKGMM